MSSPLFSLLTGGTARRTVYAIRPERTFADVILPPKTHQTLNEALAQVRASKTPRAGTLLVLEGVQSGYDDITVEKTH